MEFRELEIKGVWLVIPKRYGDSRGYFSETFRRDLFEASTGLKADFVQDNESVSTRGVIRGLHWQRGAASQGKLVRVSRGTVVDVAVDLRKGSESYGKYVAVELSAENGHQLFVPRGFAHGFAVVSEIAQFQYKVDNVYAPSAECSLRYDDAELRIEWPIVEGERVLSEKDLRGFKFSELTDEMLPGGYES